MSELDNRAAAPKKMAQPSHLRVTLVGESSATADPKPGLPTLPLEPLPIDKLIRGGENAFELPYQVKKGDTLFNFSARIKQHLDTLPAGSPEVDALRSLSREQIEEGARRAHGKSNNTIAIGEELYVGLSIAAAMRAREPGSPRKIELSDLDPPRAKVHYYSRDEVRALAHDVTNRLHEALGLRINPSVVTAITMVESSGNPLARSSAGARGLMQLMPAAAQDRWEDARKAYPELISGPWGSESTKLLHNPTVNMALGALHYHAYLIALGSHDRAVPAYNVGQKNHEDGKLLESQKEYSDRVSKSLKAER